MACLDVAAKERLAALCQLEEIPVLWDEPMKNHTSFKIGGPAAALCAPKDRQQLRELVGFVQRKVWTAGISATAPTCWSATRA